jgi:hypothetical protein
LWPWGLHSMPPAFLAGALPSESHPQPFCFSYFSNRDSHLCPGQPGPRFYLHFCQSWDVRYVPPSRWSLKNFLPGTFTHLRQWGGLEAGGQRTWGVKGVGCGQGKSQAIRGLWTMGRIASLSREDGKPWRCFVCMRVWFYVCPCVYKCAAICV